MKNWRRIIAVISTFALLLNSLSAPITVFAQTATPEPTSAPTDSPLPTATETAAPTETPTTTPDTAIEPTSTPTATPDATPIETATPSPDITPTATDSASPTPSDQPVQDQNQDSNPTTQGPPSDSNQSAVSEPSASPSVTPSATPKVPEKEGELTTTVIENVDLSTITELNSNVDVPTVTTDKPDYSPTSVAIITGTGFTTDKSYTLIVSSNDDPPVTSSDNVIADSEGAFSYAYQLDGNYRPNYKVDVKDGEFVVASTTFTDTDYHPDYKHWADKTTGNWRNGALQSSNSQYHEGEVVPHFWKADNLDTSKTYGFNIYYDYLDSGKCGFDYLAQYDSDRSPAWVTSAAYTDHSLPEGHGVFYARNADITYVSSPATSGVQRYVQVKFTPKASTSEFYWGLHLANAGAVSGCQGAHSWPGASLQTNVSDSPNISSAVDLGGGGTLQINTNAIQTNTATIELKKIWVGNGGQTTLKIGTSSDGSQKASIQTGVNGGSPLTTGPTTVNPGTYYVSESGGLTNYTKSLACTKNGQNYTPGGNDSLSVSAGDVFVCTFTNTSRTGSITITKNVVPDDSSIWNFTVTSNPPRYTGTTTLGDGGSHTFNNLTPGSYNIVETTNSNYSTTVTCGGVGPLNQNAFMGSVVAGQNLSCTFTNTLKTGSIRIVKNASGGNGTFGFSIKNSQNTSVSTPSITTSGGAGSTGSITLPLGTYSVGETIPTGWYMTGASCVNAAGAPAGEGPTRNVISNISITSGSEITCTFNNAKYGSISGFKWNDSDGDGHKDSGESKISGWKIFLDVNDNSTFDNGETYVNTNSSGNYIFSDLESGNYKICEEEKTSEGWHNTSGGVCQNRVMVNSGQDTPNINFGNRQYGSIKVCKVTIDAQGQITNGGDMPSTTFTINWTGGSGLAPTVINSGYSPNTKIFSDSETNDAYCVDYPNIPLANYGYSREIISGSGWETPKYNDQYNTKVLDLGDFKLYQTPGDENSNGYMDLTNNAGPNRTLVILNQYKVGSVTVIKFNDLDQDGVWDRGDGEDGEPTLDDWDIVLDETTQQTVSGETTFSNLVPGIHILNENLQDGYVQTNIYCDREAGNWNDEDFFEVDVAAGANIQCYIGNFQEDPKISISKTNDKAGGMNAGNTVNYSITLTNNGNIPLSNVTIQDILPGGFTYVAGSTTGATTNNPSISGSVLTWEDLGALPEGESITIHYQAVSASDLADGLYINFATCRATKDLANFKAYTKEFVREIECDPSANSTVRIGNGVSFGGSLGGQVLGISTVLGASTELPATGSSTELLIVALAALVIGLFLRMYDVKITRKSAKKVVRSAKKKGKKHAKK